MERDFRSMYVNGGEYSPADSYFPGLRFNQERTFLPSLHHYSSSSSMMMIDSSMAPVLVDSGDLQAIARGKQVMVDDHHEMKSYDFMETETETTRLKMPKYEQPPLPELTLPYGFVSPEKSYFPVTNAFCCSNSFGQLPDLRSFELPLPATSTRKRSQPSLPELQSPATDAYSLASLFKSFEFTNSESFPPVNPSPSSPAPARKAPGDAARRRRYTLSEKTRSLAKLLPWDTKMDSATMLEEAHKYIRFLQAQISVLHSMPAGAGNFLTENPNAFNYYGALGKLNRQQLLQVLVNSPVAQTTLYSRGFCIYSIEQLDSLKKIVGKKLLVMNNNLPPAVERH